MTERPSGTGEKGTRSYDRVRPFPWASLESTTHASVSAERALRAWVSTRARPSRALQALGDMLGGIKIDALVRRVEEVVARDLTPLEGGVAARVFPAEAPRGLLVEADGALAEQCVARVIRRSATRLTDPARPRTPGLSGAFAAVLAAAVRRAHVESALRVTAETNPAAALAALSRDEDKVLVASLTIVLGDEAFAARAVVPRAWIGVVAPRPWDRASLLGLGAARLSLPVVACTTIASVRDMATLRRGDAWLPENWPLVRASNGSLTGRVLLAAPDGEVGHVADLGEGGELVLRGESRPLLPASKESSGMESAKETDDLVDAIGEVSVTVRVEIGSVEMRARDWATLSNGDVIAMGRRVADPVVIRVGGAVMARGELVEIDGEIGVRITDRKDPRKDATDR
jgi:flagellar motor switch/type III secretory pathway protein FliN